MNILLLCFIYPICFVIFDCFVLFLFFWVREGGGLLNDFPNASRVVRARVSRDSALVTGPLRGSEIAFQDGVLHGIGIVLKFKSFTSFY